MKINPYELPLTDDFSFYHKDSVISGKAWANECIALSQKLESFEEKNWLLCDDDLYQYSIYFFALLLAEKNIILPQGTQVEKIQQAMITADIGIGCYEQIDNFPHFIDTIISSSVTSPKSTKLTLCANNSITLFTSGSSGKPKAIKKFWYQLANEIEVLSLLFSEGNDDNKNTVIASVTHQHIYGLLFKLLWPVFENNHIICETIEYPEQLNEMAKQFNNLVFVASPSYLARTSDYFSDETNQAITQMFCSGGVLSAAVAKSFFQQNKHAIFEIYGSTETGGIAWRQQAIKHEWLLFPEHQVEWLSDETLLLTSSFLAKGETLKTDDRVKLKNRTFALLGRVDRIVKLHEKRLSLDELEQKLQILPFIKKSHCLLLESNKLAVVIEITTIKELPQTKIEKKVLVEQCKVLLKSSFDASLLPRKWRFVKELPYNNQGKLVKSKVVALFC